MDDAGFILRAYAARRCPLAQLSGPFPVREVRASRLLNFALHASGRESAGLRCSHFRPYTRPGEPVESAPCVVYCHGNAGSRVDALMTLHALLPYGISVCPHPRATHHTPQACAAQALGYSLVRLGRHVSFLCLSSQITTVGANRNGHARAVEPLGTGPLPPQLLRTCSLRAFPPNCSAYHHQTL
jgi:hypothetical protein